MVFCRRFTAQLLLSASAGLRLRLHAFAAIAAETEERDGPLSPLCPLVPYVPSFLLASNLHIKDLSI
jgi:hypothetical protein